MKSDKKGTEMELRYREQLVDTKMRLVKIDKEIMDLKYRKKQLEAERIMIQKKNQKQNSESEIFEALRQQRLNKRK